MNTISVSCPSCGVKIRASEERAGSTAKCPKCGEQLHIPKAISEKPQSHRQKAGSQSVFKKSTIVASGAAIVFLMTLSFWLGRISAQEHKQISRVAPISAVEQTQQNAITNHEGVRDPTKEIASTESTEVGEFKQKVTHFLSEARAGAKLLKMAPSVDDTTAKSRQITELFIHLPKIPDGFDSTGTIEDRLKNINGAFAIGVEFSKMLVRASRLESPELSKTIHGDCDKLAADINLFADEINDRLK